MDELEARVRRSMAAMTAEVEPSSDLDARVAAAVTRPHRGRWMPWTAAAAAAVMVVLAVVALVDRSEDPSPVTAGPPPAPADITGWDVAPPAPVAARREATVVWTGKEAIVWGGIGRPEMGDGGGLGSADGAAFDPLARRWRRLPEAPLVGRYGHTAVWTGREMIVWGGIVNPGDRGRDGAIPWDGAAYDPVTGTWRTITPAPLPPLSRTTLSTGQAAVWTGREMLVWGRVTDKGFANEGAAYDPATDRWRAVAPLPGNRTSRAELSATPDGIIATGRVAGVPERYDATPTAVFRLTAEADLYDPGTDTWTPLPPSELSPRSGIGPVWSGRELLVPGVVTNRITDPYRVTARYRPDEGRWVDMAPVPAEESFGVGAKVWTGRELLVMGTIQADRTRTPRAFAYDPEADRWREIPAPEDRSDDSAPRAVWTGTTVLLWTGSTFTQSR